MKGPVQIFMCGGKVERCETVGCNGISTTLCDAPLRGKKAGQACRRRMCARCRREQAPGVHYCEAHDRQAKATIESSLAATAKDRKR